MLKSREMHSVDYQAEFSARLTGAHAKIEKTFLEGGEVLVSVMELVNGLIKILDGMTNSLSAEASQKTTKTLSSSIEELAKLPQTETIRLSGFEKLSNMCGLTTRHIAEISETIRYLKTFVITVKIAGAGLSELTGFADEIRDRIQHGADEVQLFAKNLEAMRAQLAKARSLSAHTQTDFGDQIPSLISGLTKNAELINKQNSEMAAIAGDVKKVAQAIQTKIASVLSSLQIGDITRQRIEHIQSTLQMLGDFCASNEGQALDKTEQQLLRDAISQMCHAQMVETANDFQRECGRILASISSFTQDAAEILRLRDELIQRLVSGDSNIYQQMEQGITEACGLCEKVQDSSAEADRVVRSVTTSAQELMRGIEVLRAIKIEIHYMALNSNLHCSKLGESGKSVAVVSGEMRIFAAKLEEPADAIVSELTNVEDTTRMLCEKSDGLTSDLTAPLGSILQTISGAKQQINDGVDALAEEGQLVFSRIAAAVQKLDFESELGDIFSQCCEIAAKLSSGDAADVSEFSEKFEGFNAAVYKLYTMAQERDIHIVYLPEPVSASKAQSRDSATIQGGGPQAESSDEDLFDDALF